MGKKDKRPKTGSRGQKKRKWKVPFKMPKFLIPKDEPIVPRPFTLIDYAGGILVFFICWAVYLHTLTPTIGFHDSGDMVTAAYVLGIPHPTGYPLYCLLGKLWMTILPIGNIAYRMNLASALCASLACMMVYFIVLKVGGGISDLVKKRGSEGEISHTPSLLHSFTYSLPCLIPAMVAALMLAFATTFWEQAVIAEKYTLNALFATLLIFILLKWAEAMSSEPGAKSRESKTPCSMLHAQRFLYLFAFTLGLSFTHHMQTMFLIPAAGYLVSSVTWRRKNQIKKTISFLPFTFSSLLKMFIFFILPFILWLYLPIRALANPILNWGDPQTLQRFISHVFAKEYGYYFSSSIKECVIRIFTHITQFFPHQFTIYLVWIGIWGLILLFKEKRRIFIFLTLVVLTDIFYSVRYTIINIEDYYIPSFTIFSIFFGYGLLNIMIYLKRYLGLYPLFFLFLIPLLPYSYHLFYSDRSKHFFAYDYNTNVLRYLDPKAILVTQDDHIGFPLWYLCYCEKKRQDISILSTLFLQYDWYDEQIRSLHPDYPKILPDLISGEPIGQVKLNNIIHNNIKSKPIYVFYDRWISKEYGLVPGGMCWQVVKGKVDNNMLYEALEKNKIKFKIRGLQKSIYKDWRTQGIIDNYTSAYCTQGSIYGNIGKYDKAIIELKKAIKLNPKFANAYYNLGIMYNNIGKYKETILMFKKVIELDPNNIEVKQRLANITMHK